jgi:hypothetical protein
VPSHLAVRNKPVVAAAAPPVDWAERADGRAVHFLTLRKPPSAMLGFSLVGLKSPIHDELGIYVQGIRVFSIRKCISNVLAPCNLPFSSIVVLAL